MEEEPPHQNQSPASRGGASTSSSGLTPSTSRGGEDRNENWDQSPELGQQQTIFSSYRAVLGRYNGRFQCFNDDTWSCVVVVLTFWFFVAMTLALGVYGTVTLQLGPNCSLLLQPNPFFVSYIKVEQPDGTVSGPMLYGFYNKPPLDVITTWSQSLNASVLSNSNMDWVYFLNVGSQLNIFYNVESSGSSPLILVIAQGTDGFARWLEDPSYPNTTLSWNIIQGKGLIQQDIRTSSNYYIAAGNLNSEMVEVQLNLKIRAFVYNTTNAYYKCTLAEGQCSLELLFPNESDAVLTTPTVKQGTSDVEWYVKLTYGPRWFTYICGIACMTSLMVAAFHFFNNCGCAREGRAGVPYGEGGSQRAPLLSYKDDDEASWGSSYESVSQDGDDPEDELAPLDGKLLKDGEYNSNTRRLCAICFDAPRDCFFLPCGHCVACFSCGTRIAEAAGTCPICCRNMKKVKKIYTV